MSELPAWIAAKLLRKIVEKVLEPLAEADLGRLEHAHELAELGRNLIECRLVDDRFGNEVEKIIHAPAVYAQTEPA